MGHRGPNMENKNIQRDEFWNYGWASPINWVWSAFYLRSHPLTKFLKFLPRIVVLLRLYPLWEVPSSCRHLDYFPLHPLRYFRTRPLISHIKWVTTTVHIALPPELLRFRRVGDRRI